MSACIALPARRYGESFDIEHEGWWYHVQIGPIDDAGAPGEVFVNAHKVNSAVDNLGADIAILISLLLQHGASAATIGHALRRNPNNSRASLAGILVDYVAAHQFMRTEPLRVDDEA